MCQLKKNFETMKDPQCDYCDADLSSGFVLVNPDFGNYDICPTCASVGRYDTNGNLIRLDGMDWLKLKEDDANTYKFLVSSAQKVRDALYNKHQH